MAGRAGAAIELVRRLPLKTISLKETFDATGRAMNILDADADEAPVEEPPAHNLRRSTRSGSQLPSQHQGQQPGPSASSALQQQHHDRFIAAFKLQSRLYHEMSQLAYTLDAINEWQVVEYAIRETGSTEFMPRNFRQQILDKFSAVKYHVGQLLSPDFLTRVANEEEAKQFDAIRCAYLPEIVVAYNSIIYVAGSFTDRERLLQSLELANTIAEERNKDVQDLFVKTGRMGELVRGLALTSRCLVRLNQRDMLEATQGGKKKAGRKSGGNKRGRGWRGETVDIWDVGRIH